MQTTINPLSREQEASMYHAPDALWCRDVDGVRWAPAFTDARGLWWVRLGWDGPPILRHDCGDLWYATPGGQTVLIKVSA